MVRLATVVGAPNAEAPALTLASELMLRIPALMAVAPVWVFAPDSVRVPVPFLVRVLMLAPMTLVAVVLPAPSKVSVREAALPLIVPEKVRVPASL